MGTESIFDRVRAFALKPTREKGVTVRYLTRRALSKLPYAPNRTRLPLAGDGALYFWWSYIDFMFHSERGFLDYWGQDTGELRFLWNTLRAGMVFFDIGAHHGAYAVVASKGVGPSGRVVAFEPSPAECSRLLLHLRMNRISNVSVESVALSSATGEAEFFRVLEGFKGRSGLRFPLFPDAPSPVEPLRVKLETLDEYVRAHGFDRLDLMKIDTEGAELDILRGGENTLSKLRPMALCEVWDYVTESWGHGASEVIRFLLDRGYLWFEFREDGTLYLHQPQDRYDEVKNFLAIPEEKICMVREWIRPEPSGKQQ